jgi:uncharacterized protein (TIGR04141 family)
VVEVGKTHTLTIYLIRRNLTAPEEILTRAATLDQHHLDLGPGIAATLYVQKTAPRIPDWASFFELYVDPEDIGPTSSAGAVLLVQSNNRIFACTFGTTGRFLLHPDAYESRFGLRVALNSIGENTVRSIDKDSIDRLARHTREQASRDAAAREFGLDIEQDLLRAVTGTPTDATLGRRITGRDAVTLTASITLPTLPELLDRLAGLAAMTNYQQNFPWVDHLAHITDVTMLEELDAILVNRLRTGNHEHTWMAVPEPIHWERVRGFRIPSRHRTPEYQDIHLQHFVDAVGDMTTLDRERLDRMVESLDHDGQRLHRWKAYRCLYCELDHGGESFVLSGGNWYHVQPDFVSDVNAAYDRIPDFDEELPSFEDVSEGEYIKRIAQANPRRFAAMDQKMVAYGGGHSKIEFCDAYTTTRDVLHVKRYGQASALSHLFAQGLTFGEVFLTEPALRERFNELVPATHRISNPQQRPNPDEYRVVFAIISDRPGPLVLPFFSRLNIKHAARRLQAYGYRVAKTKIPVSNTISRLTRVPSRRRQRR